MGRSREELIGKSDYDLFSKQQADVFWEKDDSVLKSGQTDINEEEITWHGKLHTISTKKSLFTDSVTGKKFIVGTIRDITERKRAEQALRESEQKFRLLFEGTYDLISLADADAKTLWANPAWRKIFGAESEYQTDSFSCIHPDDLERVAKSWQDLISGAATIKNLEYRYKVPKGQYLTFESCAYPVVIGQQKLYYVVARDITERKQAEEALRLERDNFTNILDSMEDGVYIVDQNYDIQYVNPALKKDFGPCEGRKCYEYFHDRNKVCPWCKNSEVFAGKTVRWEWYSARNQRTYDLVDTPLRNHDGTISKLEIFHDITERKQAEEEIMQIKESYDRLTDNADEAIFTVEAEGGHVIYTNSAAERIFGYSKAEWAEDPSLALKMIHPDYAEKQREYIKEINTTKKTIKNAVLGWIAKDGREVIMEYSVIPIIDKSGKVIYFESIGRDITERKKAEQKLLEDQVKLKSLTSQLTLAEERERRRIATELHDRIGQSLVISKMNLEALRKSEYGKKTNETLDEICNSLGRAIADTRTLTFDLSSPILHQLGFETAVAEWLTEQIEDKHGIATQFEDDGRPKPLDDDIRVLLFRDVRELFINVVKHAHAHKVKVAIRKVGKKIQVSVEDDGVGFDPAEAASTAAKRAEFGLFSIRQRLEELGGHLEIESEPGRGCKVTMTAPLKQE